jgi:Putative beta-barrel porin 2
MLTDIASRCCSVNDNQFKQRSRIRVLLAAALLSPIPLQCIAAVTLDASATARYEYNSNVFALQGGYPLPGTTDYQHSDNLYTYGAAFDANYLWDQQKLFAKLSTTDFHYDHFTQLNHNEYVADLGWNWKLGSTLDGTLEVLRNRTMVPFTSVQDAEYVLQTEQRESGKIGFQFAPDWRVEGSGYYSTYDQIILDAPNVDLTESFGQAALKYVGIASLSAGLSGGYVVGHYTGESAETNFDYRQENIALVATYEPTGRSTVDGTAGYSNRTSVSTVNEIKGFTGKIDYKEQLTGKTSYQVELSRVISSYIANVSSEIDSAAALDVRWQATYRLAVEAGYTYTYRDLPGQGNAPLGSERVDRFQYASIKAEYQPFRWLSIRPYVNLQTRTSNFIGGNFNATTYGLYFTGQWQSQPQKSAL